MRIMRQYYKWFLRKWKIQRKDGKILEIGVGTGNLAGKFLQNKYHIIGIDQSRQMLAVAKEKYPKLHVRLGEFLKIPYENQTFDVIVSTYAFHHLDEEEKRVAIAEMMRVLKKMEGSFGGFDVSE
mgnify:CR=1 FL=1